MNNKTLKAIAGGILLGAALFIMPFLILKILLIFMLLGLAFRIFGYKRMHRRHAWHGGKVAFADKVRNMNEDEYASFKKNFKERCEHAEDTPFEDFKDDNDKMDSQ